jgi:hypothetical protein
MFKTSTSLNYFLGGLLSLPLPDLPPVLDGHPDFAILHLPPFKISTNFLVLIEIIQNMGGQIGDR